MSVSVDYDPLDQMLRLVSDEVYLVVRVPAPDLARLSEIDQAVWSTGSSLRVGTSLGHPVFWARGDSDTVTVLVGHDDQTWDLALTITTTVVAEIVSVARESGA